MNKIIQGDALQTLGTLSDRSVHCIVTSPPYFRLRNYGVAGQIGLEETPEKYIQRLVEVFRECRRVLCNDGTLWLNISDSYCAAGTGTGDQASSTLQGGKSNQIEAGKRPGKKPGSGIKSKDLIGIPWMLAFALRADGWYLRQEIIWAKPNGMPGSQRDRCTSSHESIFLLSKSAKYWSDFDSIKTPPRESSKIRLAQNIQEQSGSVRANGGAKTNGAMKAVTKRDKQRGHSRTHAGFNERWDKRTKSEQQATPAMMRDVWFVSPGCYGGAHFAVMPNEIARRCVLAGCPEGGTVLDPFGGSGTVGEVAVMNRRKFIIVEINPEYIELMKKRMVGIQVNAF